MDFSFFEYNLVILTSSFIIFSLAIKNEVNQKFLAFSKILSDIKTNLLRENELEQEKEDQITDALNTQREMFKESLNTVTNYIYHTFYAIFALSLLGVLISFFTELDLFGLSGLVPQIIASHGLYVISFILLYCVARAIFLLICYTKIDNIQYLDIIFKK